MTVLTVTKRGVYNYQKLSKATG